MLRAALEPRTTKVRLYTGTPADREALTLLGYELIADLKSQRPLTAPTRPELPAFEPGPFRTEADEARAQVIADEKIAARVARPDEPLRGIQPLS
jgi:hypothetical protein